jgi:hypothetical protein
VGAAAPAPLPAFDGREAQSWIERQCALGPRVPGTAAHAAWLRMVVSHFDSLGVPLRRQMFRRPSPLGADTLALTNLLASFRPGVRPRILLGSHWDSRPWADEDPDPTLRSRPVPGANDGASSSAVLLVLARLLRANPPPLGVDLAFFDMEDMGGVGKPEEYCQGSLEMVRQWTGPLPDWVVVLDMIGSDHTEFGKEAASEAQAPDLLHLIFELARERGYSEWNPESRLAVVDDHLPFQAAGVPAVVVIGFNDPYWHTLQDDPLRTSPERLSRVGTVILDLLQGGRLAP